VNIGFSPAQLSYANGARIEILQPWEPESNPFLRRFLDHSGPGPHHLTFKVPHIEAVLDRVSDAGYEPVGVRLSDPHWREAFLHPRQATGVVVQIAQADHEWLSPPPEGFPGGGGAPAATLVHVTHAVGDLDTALDLFHRLLGGEIRARAVVSHGAWEYADLAWPGPLAIRLVAPTPDAPAASPLRLWLGDRPGRVHHLAFDLPGPLPPPPSPAPDLSADTTGAAVPGVTDPGVSILVVAPGQNLGTGLVLRATQTR
jgi:methylmalonyl-CoA/ethylmalonyl-CoA epimerase